MSNKFLNSGASTSTSLDPNSAVKTDSAGNLRASSLVVSDTTGLQALLDAKIVEPAKLAGNDGRYLKYVHGANAIWDTPAGGSGGGASTFTGLSDTPGSYTASQAVRANAAGTALEFYNPAIGEDNGGVASTISLRSTGNSATNPELKVLKAGSNVTLSSPQDPNVIQINSTGVQIDDASASASTTYSSSKINVELATKAPVSHTHVISDVTNLQTSLNNKASATHTHPISDVVNLQTELNNKASATHTHPISDVVNLQPSLDSKLDASRIQTSAEGDSTSEQDTYSCNTVFSKSEIGNSIQTKTLKVHGTSGAGYLNLGSNQTSGVYYLQQTYQGTNRTSMQTWATSGTSDTNVSWWFNRLNSLRELIRIRPQDSAKFQILDGGGIHAQGYITTDQTNFTSNDQVVTKLYVDNSVATKLSLTGGSVTGHIVSNQTTFANTQLVTKSYTDTKVASLIDDSIYRNYLVWSSTKTRDTINGLIDDTVYRTTNVWSSSKTRTEIQTAVANLVDSAPGALDTLNELAAALGDDANFSTTVTNSIAGKLSLTGGALTGNVTTNLPNGSFTSTSLVSKNYVDNLVGGSSGSSTFLGLTDTQATFTNDRFLKTTGSAVVDFELNSKTLAWTFYTALSDLPTASTVHGQIAHVHNEAAVYYSHNSAWVKLANDSRVDNSVSNIALSGADLSVTRQDGSAFLVPGVNPPAMSWAVQSGTVSNSGATLQLSQTNGSPAAITGLTPSTIADTCLVSATVSGSNSTDLVVTTKAGSATTHTSVLVPPSSGNANKILVSDGSTARWATSTLHPTAGNLALREPTGAHGIDMTFAAGTPQFYMDTTAASQYPQMYTRVQRVAGTGDQLLTQACSGLNASGSASVEHTRVEHRVNSGTQGAEYGEIEFSCAYNGTPNTEMMRIGGNNTYSVNVNGVLRTQLGCMFGADSNRVQTAAVLPPTTSGHVLTATGVGAWAWAAASGGSSGPVIPNSKKINQLSLSGNTLTAEDGTTTYDAYGILWGDRYMTYVIENTFVRNRSDAAEYEINHLHNGYRATGFSPFDDPPDQYRAGGHVIWQHQDGLYIKLNALHFHYYNNGNPNMTMAFYGSNDKVTWTKLKEWNQNDASAYTNGYQTTSYTINGTSVSIPARGPSNLTKTVYNTATALSNTNNASGCRRYVFDNTEFYMFYMLKNIGALEHPNMSATHNVSLDSQLEWEY